MKKIVYFLVILIFPLNIFAYSNHIIVGGETLGIEVNSKGIIIVGLYKINGIIINPELQVGDKIIKVGNSETNTTNELVTNIEKNMKDNKVKITYMRNNIEKETDLHLSLYKGNYRTGLYVKGSILGIGTLSYIDPETGIYGLLGHNLNISETNQKIEVKDGKSYEATVTSFTRSTDGNPGSKNADIDRQNQFGSIEKNSNYGVFGKIKTKKDNSKLMEVGKLKEVKVGPAYIYTTNTTNTVEKYTINIIEVNDKSDEKNIFFEVTDSDLIEMSGGIVQGMSGSPIIQDDKIIGAVTRVLVDEVTHGYGISIITMLEEGDKLN